MSTSKVNLANIESVPKGGFYLHRQMASCVLSASKPFSVPENDLPLAGEKRFRSQRFLERFSSVLACSDDVPLKSILL